MRLLIAGGGTGGHLFPAIAVAEEFVARDKENEVLFVGTKGGIEGRLLPESGWPVSFVMSGGIKGKGLFGTIKGLSKMVCGVFQSAGIILGFRPGAVLGVGGYASVPAVVAGRLMGIRSAIHEQNSMPGITNRVLGRFVNRVFLTYPESGSFFPRGKIVITGNPLRKEIIESLEGMESASRDEGSFTLLIFGGSRGARRLNEVILEAVRGGSLPMERIRIIHQTGHDGYEAVSRSYADMNINAEVYPFIEGMADAYGRADLVICRAGATSIAELMAAGKPAILVPYPYAADDHQAMNARSVVDAGAARMILERDLNGALLAAEITGLCKDREALRAMSEKALKLSRTDAAAVICDELKRL